MEDLIVSDSLTERVERLEVTVEGLASLPAEVREIKERVGSVEVQLVQLRGEMRNGFIALRTELGEQIETNWQRTRALFEDVIDRIKTLGE